MSKSKQEIRIDFQHAKSQSYELDRIATALFTLTNSTMERSMQMLAGAWKGENSEAFLRKEQLLQKEIKATATTLRDIAEDIRDIARRIYDTEMENLQQIKRKKS